MTENSKKELHLYQFHFGFSLTRRQTAFLISVVFLALLVSPIATESVTLTTYYPAPAGAYNNMVTIGDTWLARDGNSFVEIGTNTPTPTPGTKLAVINGSVGIGTTNPQDPLSVVGSATVDQNNSNSGGGLLPGLRFGTNSGEGIASPRTNGAVNQYGLNFYTGWTSRMYITNSGNVGIGTIPSNYQLTVANTIASQKNCTQTSYPLGTGWTSCPGGMYATYAAGVFSTTQWGSTLNNGTQTSGSGMQYYSSGGFMLCCNP
jgi:hypothetical protein